MGPSRRPRLRLPEAEANCQPLPARVAGATAVRSFRDRARLRGLTWSCATSSRPGGRSGAAVDRGPALRMAVTSAKADRTWSGASGCSGASSAGGSGRVTERQLSERRRYGSRGQAFDRGCYLPGIGKRAGSGGGRESRQTRQARAGAGASRRATCAVRSGAARGALRRRAWRIDGTA